MEREIPTRAPEDDPGRHSSGIARIGSLVKKWELDPRLARLRCRTCKRWFSGRKPRFFWAIAAKRGQLSPWWWSDYCPQCRKITDAKSVELEVSDTVSLELPREE